MVSTQEVGPKVARLDAADFDVELGQLQAQCLCEATYSPLRGFRALLKPLEQPVMNHTLNFAMESVIDRWVFCEDQIEILISGARQVKQHITSHQGRLTCLKCRNLAVDFYADAPSDRVVLHNRKLHHPSCLS